MQMSPNELLFKLEMAMIQGHVYTLKDELTATYHCELTPEQEPKHRARAQAAVARKRECKKEIDHLKRGIKTLQAEEELLDSEILNSGEALNFTPPKGRFNFTGRHVASIELRREWLCDLETGAPILETCQELSKASVVAIDEIRQGIQESLPFPDGDDDSDIDAPVESDSPETPFGESEKPPRKKACKPAPESESEPDPTLN